VAYRPQSPCLPQAVLGMPLRESTTTESTSISWVRGVSIYLSGARRPPPVGVGMKGPLPSGNQRAPAFSNPLPTHCWLAAFHGKAFPWVQAATPLRRDAVRQAGAAPPTSPVVHATTVGALGRQRSGAHPEKPLGFSRGEPSPLADRRRDTGVATCGARADRGRRAACDWDAHPVQGHQPTQICWAKV
jgi:hypothetical protein